MNAVEQRYGIVTEQLSRLTSVAGLTACAEILEQHCKRRIESVAYETLPNGERGDEVGRSGKLDGRWGWYCETDGADR